MIKADCIDHNILYQRIYIYYKNNILMKPLCKKKGDPLPYCFAGFLNPSRVGIRRPSELGMVVLHALVLLYVEDHTDFLQDLFMIYK